jgi:hypothetical protein
MKDLAVLEYSFTSAFDGVICEGPIGLLEKILRPLVVAGFHWLNNDQYFNIRFWQPGG